MDKIDQAGTERISSKSGHDITPLTPEAIAALARRLTDEEAQVILRQGTERPFCGAFLDNKLEGTYVCRLCGLPLFASSAKFDSGTGWPSFFAPVDPDHLTTIEDRSHGMARTEIVCRRCKGHLGHVFADGPPPTGERHCLNSVSLEFFEDDALPERSRPAGADTQTETAYFAGGCFWGVEDRFQRTPGVIDAVSGYQGGHTGDPTYKDVCAGATGHAEAVRVTFDPRQVSYRDLLEVFFTLHDPTQRDRQGPDVGSQYRSAIFAANEAQLEEARRFADDLRRSKRFGDRPIATQIEPAGTFFEAEERHQDYNAKHGRSCGI